MLIVFKYLVPKGYTAITLFPFVFLKHTSLKANKVLLNHENIHLRQQIELLVVGFYLWYVIEFLVRLIIYKNWLTAYRNISFEREAYENEHNFLFLKHRGFLNFTLYL